MAQPLLDQFGTTNGRIARMLNSIHQPQKLEVIFRRSLKAKLLDKVVAMLQQAKPQAKRKPKR